MGWTTGSVHPPLSTVVAQWGSAAVYVIWVVRARSDAHEVQLAPHAGTLREISVVGRDLFIRTAALRGSFLAATAVATRIGTVDVAAHQIAFEIWNVTALTLDAIAIAGQSIIGRLLGASEVRDAHAAGRRMLQWGLVWGLAIGVIILVLRNALPGIFTSDLLVRDLTAFLLVFVGHHAADQRHRVRARRVADRRRRHALSRVGHGARVRGVHTVCVAGARLRRRHRLVVGVAAPADDRSR